jgi:Zn-dependent alcohol dehydrogenase
MVALTLGATHAFHPADVAGGALDKMKVPLDFAIDTSGRPEMIRAAVTAVHSEGVVVLIAAGRTGAVADIPLRDLIVGRQVRGAVEGDSVPRLTPSRTAASRLRQRRSDSGRGLAPWSGPSTRSWPAASSEIPGR